MTKVTLNPGPCNLASTITASSEDMMSAKLTIDSQCDQINNIADKLENVDAMKEVFANYSTSGIYEICSCLTHVACPFPSAVIKAIEVECGLALASDVIMKVSKE